MARVADRWPGGSSTRGYLPTEPKGDRIDPQDYSERTEYRPPAPWYRRLNRIGVPLTSLGLAPRDAVTLEVQGRSSGKPRRVPILRTTYQGADYLVALAG